MSSGNLIWPVGTRKGMNWESNVFSGSMGQGSMNFGQNWWEYFFKRRASQLGILSDCLFKKAKTSQSTASVNFLTTHIVWKEKTISPISTLGANICYIVLFVFFFHSFFTLFLSYCSLSQCNPKGCQRISKRILDSRAFSSVLAVWTLVLMFAASFAIMVSSQNSTHGTAL